ncbi:hypothetical protein BCR41DRAFT_344525 [Lobosporangium transversale]|uniref:F-box domain-containing protein n=1 Tax=Lobosporangium transversale TaxID=64571 RepID=A0A1Y2H3F6_9FUNG|nr:hypothetical protein BCR41DRAFT_344525 [Lobosporangium transversale]ORZ29089.1 hypothetical protein BCR41DRAFT_344525 [Lobosporangium transversale]|eukprot:XP_021886762.1 hypothetical protein BCR41DRAFT_344525 [Lobosporangium transversale]
MDNFKLNPLVIPEIILILGDFLDDRDLPCCIRVSKTFYNTLSKTLWRNINVKSRWRWPCNPSKEALQNNKKYIEKISLQNIIPKEIMSLRGCDRLYSIEYERERHLKIRPDLRGLSDLLKAYSSTIRELSCNGIPIPQGFWQVLLECTNLSLIKVNEVLISSGGVELFLQLCKRVRNLDLRLVRISQLPADFITDSTGKYILTNVQKLDLGPVKILHSPFPYKPSYCIGTLVRRCPNLRSFTFDDEPWRPGQRIPYDFYKVAFLQQPWTLTNLSELTFPHHVIKDTSIAAVLRQMTGLRRLEAPNCDFGQLSIRELLASGQEIMDGGHIVRKTRLRRLSDTIETMVINEENLETDGVVQMVLSNCPHLKKLTGPRITVTEIVKGAEWVSTELTELSIFLEADIDQGTEEGMEKQRIVFRQLGKLARLHYLNLTGQDQRFRKRQTLDLRLRAGLDELVNLKDLETLEFRSDYHQQMQPEDATWIVNNWPKLKYSYLHGRVNNRQSIHDRVVGILCSRNTQATRF